MGATRPPATTGGGRRAVTAGQTDLTRLCFHHHIPRSPTRSLRTNHTYSTLLRPLRITTLISMAQPVYSEHPLEAYLRRQRLPSLAHGIRTHTALKCLAGSGEGVEPMPGSAADFEPEEVEDEEDDAALPDSGWLPPAVQQIFEVRGQFSLTTNSCYSHVLQVLQTSLSSRKTVNQRRELAERFKYDVISSSLLTTSLATPLPHSRRPASPDIPGRLRSHSRNPSLAQSHPWHPPPKPQVTLPDMGFSNEQTQHWALVFTCAASFAAALRFYLLSALLLAIASYPYVADHPPAKSDSMLAVS